MSGRSEAGQITVMTVGFLVVLGLVMVMVVNASGVFLHRQQLNALADGAALAAADGLDGAAFYTEGTVTVDAGAARQLAADYLAASGQPVRSVHVSLDDTTITVRLERHVDLAISPPGWSAQTVVVSEASSQLRPSP